MNKGEKNSNFAILPFKPNIVTVQLRKEIKPMNVQINLTDTKSFNNDSKVDISTNSKTSKDTIDLGKVSILDRLRNKHGYNTNRNESDSKRTNSIAKIQCKSFNLCDLKGWPEIIDQEPVSLNKPYTSPFMNTLNSHRTKTTTFNLIKKKHNTSSSREPKHVLTGQIDLDISPNAGISKGHIRSNQFKKSNAYTLANH